MSTPQTTVYICSGVRLNSKQDHSIYFATESAQQAYFSGKVVKTLPAYSYVRRSWTLKVESNMSDALKWNYLYFKNASSDPSYYYYFIDRVEYVNDLTVELTLTLDVIQTYVMPFEEVDADGNPIKRVELLPCFIERMHVENDAVGRHLLDEGLDLGEYTNDGGEDVEELTKYALLTMSTYNMMIQPTSDANVDTTVNPPLTNWQGVFHGIPIYIAKLEGVETAYPGSIDFNVSNVVSQVNAVYNYLGVMDGEALTDSILSMWMYPYELIMFMDEENEISPFRLVEGTKTISKRIPKKMSFDGYIPRNNKLYTYPYTFLYATNNMGDAGIYKYERFPENADPTFNIEGSCTPEGGIRMYPNNYNGNRFAYEEGLTLGSFPTCSWDADPYKIWLAQNQHQLEHAESMSVLKIGAGIASSIGSLAMGNVLGAVGGIGAMVSGVNDIQAMIAQKKDADAQPIQGRGSYSPSANFINRKHTFTFYYRHIDAEHARIIDDFFTMYGYKVNEVKKPNLNARGSFTYVKTRGCHAVGNLCNEDILTIEGIFDKGVTFWKDGDKIGDYTQANLPI